MVIVIILRAADGIPHAAAEESVTPIGASSATSSDYGTPSRLPLPSTMSTLAYEQLLFPFLHDREYQRLGWRKDKQVRDTGPYINGTAYGTHPAVRIFYSPEIIHWLLGEREGIIPDGAMIVKEHYQTPAARHEGKDNEQLWAWLRSWTVMVKDSKGSHDGWFWSNPVRFAEPTVNHEYPFPHAASGFGHYCIRCHASTHSPGDKSEYTFSSLRNIEGFPGRPILFRIDESWRNVEDNPPLRPVLGEANKIGTTSHDRCANQSSPTPCVPRFNAQFATAYPSIEPVDAKQVRTMPPVTHDWAIMDREATESFVTSNQCMSCHAGLVGEFGPTMFVATGGPKEKRSGGHGGNAEGWHVSPYGEWRWSPMGLAGRDPVFHAQLESEVALIQEQFASDSEKATTLTTELQSLCLSCHGAMGKHQFDLDHSHHEDPPSFGPDHVYQIDSPSETLGRGSGKYGALARDGISCTICHRSQPREQPADDHRSYLEFFLATSITGNVHFGPPGEIYGPFPDAEISPYVMQHAISWKPQHSDYIQSSRMCGSCHTVNLPILDKPFLPGETPAELVEAEPNPLLKPYHHHVEQATYLEWLNSSYENEFHPDSATARSCQDCHMSRGLDDPENGVKLDEIVTRIAAIQDTTYPDAENLADHEDLLIRLRKEGFRRHNFVGLNLFLIEIFDQFDDILGVRKHDFMTGSKTDLKNAKSNYLRVARHEVADLAVTTSLKNNGILAADVVVENKVGHRFPSGVGFRRAFLEFVVIEDEGLATERMVWSSGRTNELGMLVDASGSPLPTEFFDKEEGTDKQRYQPHHEVIRAPEQVQVYETLLWNAKHEFTTSFVRGCTTVKDNRLLPRGWRKEGPDPALHGKFLQATWPGPVAMNDPDYVDGSGSDRIRYEVALPDDIDRDRLSVRAKLFYQSMPPYFLQSLFETAPDGEATRRLHYLLSNLKLEGTPIEGWKLEVATATTRVAVE